VVIQDNLVENSLTVFLTVILVIGLSFFAADFFQISIPILVFPAIMFLFFYPKFAVYALVFSIYINSRILVSPPILLVDLMALTLLASFMIGFLARIKATIKLPFIFMNYIFLFFALVITGIYAELPEFTYTPITRIVFQLVLTTILFNLIKKDQVKNLLKFYFIIAILHSIANVLLFFGSMGEIRYFGLASLYYDDLTMLIVPVGLACFLWIKSNRYSLYYGIGTVILLLGLISTHSRGPLLTVFWVSIILIVYSSIKAKKIDAMYVRRRIKILLISASVLFSVLLITFLPIFEVVIGRFGELADFKTGTIRLRMILWNAAWMSFTNHPLVGIGPGNFRYVGSIFPVLKQHPLFYHVSSLSAHNLVMHYLAENGMIGTIPLLALFFTYVRKSWGFVKGIGNSELTPYLIGLFFTAVTISFSIFYLDGWLWGQNAYALPFFMALSARMVFSSKDEK